MLEVRDVRKAFDGFQAVGGVTLGVARGQIAAIIGPNGAGKTTFFNLVTGHLRPDAGVVILNGRDITGLAPHDVCRLGMGRSFQRTNIFPRLTVFENVQAAFISHRGRGLSFFARVEGLYRDETYAVLESVGLQDKAGEVSGFLSHGNQKQLELGIALASEPELLLLDEPTAGMSATETRETIRLIERITRDRGLTLLFTEHDMEVVFSIAQRISVLHLGRLIAEGAPAEVRSDPEVRRVYQGERARRHHACPGQATRGSSRAHVARYNDHAARRPRDRDGLRAVAGALRRLHRGQRGRVRLPARPQRRGQDDDHAQHHGPDPTSSRPRGVERYRHHGLAALSGGARRPRLRARRPADLR